MKVQRAALLDEYVEGGEGVYLLQDGRVLALSELPTAVMQLLQRSPCDLPTVVEHITSRFGMPAEVDSTMTVRAILLEMSESGLLDLEIR